MIGTPGRDSTSVVLQRADQAILSAKSSGGRSVARFSPELSDKYAIRTTSSCSWKAPSTASTAFVLHYLPEFDMRTGEVLGAEALIRWQHPTRGLVMPESFIGVVESINFAGRLGRLVMRSAFEQFRLWRSQGIGEHAVLRVTVSPVQWLRRALSTWSLPPSTRVLSMRHRMPQDNRSRRRSGY